MEKTADAETVPRFVLKRALNAVFVSGCKMFEVACEVRHCVGLWVFLLCGCSQGVDRRLLLGAVVLLKA